MSTTIRPPLPPYEEWPVEDGSFAMPHVFIDYYMGKIGPTSTAVFASLCRVGWPMRPGVSRPTPRELSRMTGVTVRTIGKALMELQDWGLIPRTPIPQYDCIWQVWDEDDFTCLACGTRRDLTIDHITPLASGGSNDRSNLQTLCRSCNAKKGSR